MYSDTFLSTLLKHLLAAITASSLPGYDATNLAHLYLGIFPHSFQALSGWMGSVAAQLFSGLFRDVRSGSSLGSGWDIQRLVPKPLLRCLGCELRVVVLLEDEPSPQSEVLSALEQVFIKDLSVHCSVHLYLDPD